VVYMINFKQPNFNEFKGPNRKRYLSVIFFVLLAMGVLYGGVNSSSEIDVANDGVWDKMANIFNAGSNEPTIDDDPDYTMPKPEPDRWDILILGIRGEDQKDADETGAMLSDTMILLSYDKTTGKTSLVSIPRDLYVRIYGSKKDKINTAYAVGLLRRNGIGFTKKLVSRITGVYVDNVVVFDFSSFKQIIDDLGGVDIHLDQPFSEKQQWGYEFNLPAGDNHLDSEAALYYARSRFSSSDFDRAQRQQKLIMAIKDKILELNLLKEPLKTLGILNTIKSNINTDLSVWDTNSLMKLSKEFDGANENLKEYIITTENLVYQTYIETDIGHIYVLLPKGDNLQGIKQMFREILN
jgi:LCP family protein required for cell wall assembly